MDEIERLFAEITPEDLLRDTSAIQEIEVTIADDSFGRWAESLVSLCHQKAEADEFLSFAVLFNGERQRMFRPDDDETPVDFTARLTREARAMNARWFFVGLIAPGRVLPAAERLAPDEDNPEHVMAALKRGELQLSLCWVTIRRLASGTASWRLERRGGIMQLQSGADRSSQTGRLEDDNIFYNVIGEASDAE